MPRFGGAAPKGGPQAGSEGYRQLAIRALLECRPGLLSAWLDAEHWADAIGVKPLLWCSDGAGVVGLQELEKRCAQLEDQLDQERDHVAMLNRYIKQMEKELDHFVANHERAATAVAAASSSAAGNLLRPTPLNYFLLVPSPAASKGTALLELLRSIQ